MTIRNIGTAPSSDNLVNGIRISNEYQWSALMKSVAPNGTQVIDGVLKTTAPNRPRPNQALHLIAMVDAPIAAGDTSIPVWGRQQESNEKNNTKALGVPIPARVGNLTTTSNSTTKPAAVKPGGYAGPRPTGGAPSPADLVVETFELQGQVQHRDGKLEIPIRMTIRNQGDVPSPDKVFNGVSYRKQYHWSAIMKSVPAHGTIVKTGVVKIPDSPQLQKGRSVKLIAMADAPIAAADTSIPKWGRVQEGNETNNQRVLTVNVPGGLGFTSKPDNPGTAPNEKLSTKKSFGKK
jgi:hypothetical protein